MNIEERAAGPQRRRIIRVAGAIALVWTLLNAASRIVPRPENSQES